ncbi:MAG: cytochrome c biogenesis protein ResB [Opitutales bacterium]
MGKIFNFIASIRFSIVLMLYGALLIFVGTLEQQSLGIDVVQAKFFESYFCMTSVGIPMIGGFTIGILLFLNLSFSLIKYARFSFRGLSFIVAHLSLLMLILAGFIQYEFRQSATLVLHQGQDTHYLSKFKKNTNFIEESIDLGFSVKLIKFEAQKWDSSNIHKEFSSLVEVNDKGNKAQYLISMNKPLSYAGWTFYQNSYQNDGHTSIIGAVKTPFKQLPWISVMMTFFAMCALYIQKLISKRN